MQKRSKRFKQRSAGIDTAKTHSLEEAVKLLKGVSQTKFDETVSVNFQLGIRADQSDEMVRGTVVLPHGTGKKLFVVCVCKGEAAREAQDAGADLVGAEEIIKKVQDGWLEFDAMVAHPDMMRELSKLGKVLGPRGLMPSPKAGTVTTNVAKAVNELKAGRVEFKSDKTGGVHAICGKLSFAENVLIENARALIRAVRDAKPAAAKGDYLKRITLSVTQGPGVRLASNLI